MRKVAIVIDSTANLPQPLLDQYQIHVVPQMMIWDQATFRDGIDISPTQFYARLSTSKTIPTTSQVTPAVFLKLFEELLAQDYDVLAVLISSKLSGTVQSAVQAIQILGSDRVALVDSNSTTLALGFQALVAARAAEGGASLLECKQLVENTRSMVDVLFVVDTLKYLHMGGRIGGGARFLGTALNLKPILELIDGRIEAIERVRTKRKAVERIQDLLENRIAGRTPLHLGVLHANALPEAVQLLEQATQRFNPVESYVSDVSPVVGVHSGPGVIGLAILAGI